MTDTTPETARLTADLVVVGLDGGHRHVLLIERGWDPYAGYLALPGGHVDVGEDVEAAARRELAEETGLVVEWVELVGVYAEPGRDPRGRYATFAYAAYVDGLPRVTAGDDAKLARWERLDRLHELRLAFDHRRIITDAEGGGQR